MRTTLALGILGLCTLSLGCGPITLATRTLVLEPIHYCTTADNVMEWRRNYQLAEAAWKEAEKAADSSAEPPPLPYSPDYAKGFKDGFADYLYAGGTGEPPPLPPRHYWKLGYETPEGHQAIDDWFAGFRHGAAVACASGYRQWVTVPTSVPPREALARHAPAAAPAAMTAPAAGPEKSTEPMLPPPRTLPPSQDLDGPGQSDDVPANSPPPSVPGDPLQEGPTTGRESGYQGVPIACSRPTRHDPKRNPSSIPADTTPVAWSEVTLLRPRKLPAVYNPENDPAPPVSAIAVASNGPTLLPPRKLPSLRDSASPGWEDGRAMGALPFDLSSPLYVHYPGVPRGPVLLPK